MQPEVMAEDEVTLVDVSAFVHCLKQRSPNTGTQTGTGPGPGTGTGSLWYQTRLKEEKINTTRSNRHPWTGVRSPAKIKVSAEP